jgi:lipopolysaccharide transport system permease protein
MNAHEVVIEAGRSHTQYWKDLWHYRELFYFLAWRDILVRYKQTVVGVSWSVLRPVAVMVILTVVFNKVAGLDAGPVPYPLIVFAALLPWQFFANSMAECSNSLLANATLISKVYFPRLIVPAGAVIVSVVDFLISAGLALLLMVWYQFIPGREIVYAPLFTLLALAASLGVGLWVAALTVKYRDFRFVVPFIVQFGLYISPVGFTSDKIPGQWRLLYALNPMVGVIDGFRWVMLGSEAPLYWPSVAVSTGMIALLLSTGIWHFRQTERLLADVI